MKKKYFIAMAAVALVMLPLMAFAATEFTLGGYLKLQTGYQSVNDASLNFSNFIMRNNNTQFPSAISAVPAASVRRNAHHGKFLMDANGSRFNLTIKGPEVWGAKITGLFEVDFDGSAASSNNAAGTATTRTASVNQAALRLRHAMFRLNWPETELMIGQYWSMLSEWAPEVIDAGAMCQYGVFSYRVPQIRLTQKFAGDWLAAVAIEGPENGRWGLDLDAQDTTEGESSETPRFEAKVQYSKDLWGKAAYFGAPKGFTAEVGGAWQRTRHTDGRDFTTAGYYNMGQGNYVTPLFGTQRDQQYTDNWVIQGVLFIPVIPTYTKNLAGTMSVLTNWWIGQGMSPERNDLPMADRYWVLANALTGDYDIALVKRYGGMVQAQYYFNNEWFTNVSWGMNRAFGVNQGSYLFPGSSTYSSVFAGDAVKLNTMINANLWYRPIQALKFGMQYTWQQTNYFQTTTRNNNSTDKGDAHTLMFGGFFFF